MFRAARESQGLTQYDVAELTEGKGSAVSRGAISDIERGQNMPSVEVLVSLSRVLNVEPVEVLERVDLSMAPRIDLTGVTLDELKEQAEKFFWAGDYRRALGVYDAMFERLVLEPPDDPAERRRLTARIEVNRAVTLRQCSALRASEESAKRAVSLAAGISELQAEAYMVLGSLHAHDGNTVLAELMLDQAARLAEDCGPAVRGLALCQKGAVLHRAGRFAEAHETFLEARRWSVEARDQRNLIIIEGSIGSCLIELGKKKAGRAQLVKSVELARKHGDPAHEASRLVELGRLSLDDGKLDEADEFARAALRIAKPAARSLTVFRAEWLRHRVVLGKRPGAADRHRIAHLRRLYAQVKGHRTIDAVAEFRERVLAADKREGK